MITKCPHCGERVSPKDEYCPMCDYRLKKPENKILVDNRYETAAEQYSCKKDEHKGGDHTINLHGNETAAERYSCRDEEHKYNKERKTARVKYNTSKNKQGFVNKLSDVSKDEEILGKVVAVTIISFIFYFPGWILSAIVIYNYVKYSPALRGKALKNGDFVDSGTAKEKIGRALRIEAIFIKFGLIVMLAAAVLTPIITILNLG